MKTIIVWEMRLVAHQATFVVLDMEIVRVTMIAKLDCGVAAIIVLAKASTLKMPVVLNPL